MRNKAETNQLATEVVALLRDMFGEGIEFSYQDCYRTNEALTGIFMSLPGCPNKPTVYLEDMPGTATAQEIAGIAAAKYQEFLRSVKRGQFPGVPDMSRENILSNVVLQALSRKRNRQLLREHPHILSMDLAGIFRLPVGPYRKNTLNSALISNEIAEKQGLTTEELAEAARRNTVEKFGIQLISARDMERYFVLGRERPLMPFETIEMTQTCLYTLTNNIEINGAALIFIPEILEKLGEKAEKDYFILPSSIHELMVIREGICSRSHLKELVHEGNRRPDVVRQTDVLSDNVYHYCRKSKSLSII